MKYSTIKYSAKDKEKVKIYTNAYIKFLPIYDFSSFSIFFGSGFISNVEDEITFLERLKEHEEKFNSSSKKEKSKGVRYGYYFEIMIGDYLNNDNLQSFVNEFINNVFGIEIPYSYKLDKKGKAYYLSLCVVDRTYNEKGYEYKTLAKRDIYKNSKTGKLCKSDNPEGQLIHKKGDVINNKLVYFSNKLETLRFSSRNQFDYFLLQTKKTITKLLSCLGLEVTDDISVTKLQRTGNFSQKNYARKINKYINELEKNADHFLYCCKMCECSSIEANTDIINSLERYVGYLKGDKFSCKKGNRKMSFALKYRFLKDRNEYKQYLMRLSSQLSLIKESFDLEVTNLMKKHIPVSF